MAVSKKILFEKSAEKFIKKQPFDQQKRLLKAIMGLPENGDILKMKGYSSLYRLRVGGCRVLYKMEQTPEKIVITVSDIDNRGQVYK